ncbi:hypothetical protein ABZ319_15775 [Nocardia sp. NPDC005978]|uniref:hypothetical protein n=1 Tax=Nocardia sp. NPDC005978 TaxID=3156725 RepID=UPI0033B30E4D
MGGVGRHFDERRHLLGFTERILVVCAGCGGRAVSSRWPGTEAAGTWAAHEPRRLACARCAVMGEWDKGRDGTRHWGRMWGNAPVDMHFGRPLWLQTRCAGRVLWALNVEHVEELGAFVGARLREHGAGGSTTAMLASLPGWIKAAGNRDSVLKGLERLRALAEVTAPEGRPSVG